MLNYKVKTSENSSFLVKGNLLFLCDTSQAEKLPKTIPQRKKKELHQSFRSPHWIPWCFPPENASYVSLTVVIGENRLMSFQKINYAILFAVLKKKYHIVKTSREIETMNKKFCFVLSHNPARQQINSH